MLSPIHIFRPGRHTAMSGATLDFSADDLRAAAVAYDPTLHEAPLVVGHPEHDHPAYGWVESLRFGDAGLEAVPTQVNGAFAELVKAGAFKKISASFYPPDSPNNPKPGAYYLRHVGFLGAQPPAIKGLRPVQFAGEGEAVITLEFAASERRPEMDEVEKAKAELATREQELAVREKRIVEAEAKAERKAVEDWAERQVAAGRLLPGEKTGLVDVLGASPVAGTFQFGEAQVGPRGWLEKFVEGLPVRVDYAELTAAESASAGSAAAYAAPPGYHVDQGRLELHRKALAYAEQNKVEYVVAIQAVSR